MCTALKLDLCKTSKENHYNLACLSSYICARLSHPSILLMGKIWRQHASLLIIKQLETNFHCNFEAKEEHCNRSLFIRQGNPRISAVSENKCRSDHTNRVLHSHKCDSQYSYRVGISSKHRWSVIQCSQLLEAFLVERQSLYQSISSHKRKEVGWSRQVTSVRNVSPGSKGGNQKLPLIGLHWQYQVLTVLALISNVNVAFLCQWSVHYHVKSVLTDSSPSKCFQSSSQCFLGI